MLHRDIRFVPGEDTMEARRWLLPFTHGVDMRAIETAVRFAESAGAMLVSVSLLSAPDKPRSQGIRLEHIAQSNDFLEAVQHLATRYRVPVERHEIVTRDVLQSIALFAREQCCDSIVLVTIEREDVLLQARELKHLLADPPTSLMLIRLPAEARYSPLRQLGTRVLSWLRGSQNGARMEPEAAAVEEPLWIRMEEHPRG